MTDTAMNFPNNLSAPFWEIAPSMVREPYREVEQAVPVIIVGDPLGEVSFQSTHPDIARVEEGMLRFGATPGATVVTAEAILDGQVHSRRYIQVDVERPAPSAVLDWQASGNVERLPDGTWHFYYFSGWFDEDGSNIRATGELSTPVFLDRDYLLRFDVWGEIESVDGTERAVAALSDSEADRNRRPFPIHRKHGQSSFPVGYRRRIVSEVRRMVPRRCSADPHGRSLMVFGNGYGYGEEGGPIIEQTSSSLSHYEIMTLARLLAFGLGVTGDEEDPFLLQIKDKTA